MSEHAQGLPLNVRTDGLYQIDSRYPVLVAHTVAVDAARTRVIEAAEDYLFTGRGHSELLRRKLIGAINAHRALTTPADSGSESDA